MKQKIQLSRALPTSAILVICSRRVSDKMAEAIQV